MSLAASLAFAILTDFAINLIFAALRRSFRVISAIHS